MHTQGNVSFRTVAELPVTTAIGGSKGKTLSCAHCLQPLPESTTMLALVQRVREASVSIDGKIVGAIGPGLLALICAERGDRSAEAERLLGKILKLRIFADEDGKMNRSLQDCAGGLLVVSQFTLAADTSGGNRPSFSQAADPITGEQLYEHFVERARAVHPDVASGRFAADMQVMLINDGPVTIPLRITPAQHNAQQPA